MEVTIKTTKLKSTIIKQFQRIQMNEIEGAECLGYVINIIKDSYKVFIIKLANGEYRKLESGWYYYENSSKIYLKIGKGTGQIDLGSVDNVKTFAEFRNKCENESQQIFV